MKKIFLVILFLSFNLYGQSNIIKMFDDKPKFQRGYAVDLDGTTEYMSKSSPTKLDLNGDERITTATNRTFETTVGDWVAVGSASIDTSSAQKQSGVKSLKIVTSGAWSGAELSYSAFTALQQDANGIYEKYTFEFWAYNESADTVQVVIGDKSIKRNIPATTWTKFVYNFQITTNTINQNIQIFFKTTGKTNYVDNVSLTKAWDVLINAFLKTTSLANMVFVGRATIFGAGTQQYAAHVNSSGYLTLSISDEASIVSLTPASSPYNNGLYFFYSGIIEKTNNLSLLYNGTPLVDGSRSIIGVGKVKPNLPLTISGRSNQTQLWNGQLGEVQITRFTDISQSNVNTTTLTQAYKLGIPKSWIGGGAEVVAHYKFRGASDADMLQDLSGNGNDLTGTNVSTTDQVKASYPSR